MPQTLAMIAVQQDRGVEELVRHQSRSRSMREQVSRRLKDDERLAEALISGSTSVERAAKVLSLPARAVLRIADGKTTLAKTAWRRLFKQIDTDNGR